MNRQILGCLPVTPRPATQAAAETVVGLAMAPYQGSVEGKCMACEAGVWIGPAQQQAMLSTGVDSVVLCLDCMARLQVMRGAPAVQVKALTGKKWGE